MSELLDNIVWCVEMYVVILLASSVWDGIKRDIVDEIKKELKK
jgi:hypothetical protein